MNLFIFTINCTVKNCRKIFRLSFPIAKKIYEVNNDNKSPVRKDHKSSIKKFLLSLHIPTCWTSWLRGTNNLCEQ